MIVPGDKRLGVSKSNHSLSNINDVTTPSYENYWIANQKAWNAAGMQGMGCASCTGLGQTGVFGTNLFESMDPTTWGVGEYAILVVGGYFIFSTFYTTSQAVGYAKSIPGQRRKKRAAYYRELAKKEERSKGFF